MLGLLTLLTLCGCVTPAQNHGAFAQNGTAALKSTLSSTASARAALQESLAGRAPRAFVDVVVTDSEKAIAPIEASFGGVDPPDPADDDTRDAVLTAIGDAGDALSSARIAVRRGDDDGIRQALTELDAADGRLNALADSLR